MRYTQPQSGPFRLDPSNALVRGLTFCLDHYGTDLVAGKYTKLPATTVKSGIAADLQTNDIDVYASASLALGTEWSIAYSFIPTSLSGTFDLFFERNVKADGNHFELYKDSSTGKIALYIVSSAGVLVGGPVLTAGVPVDAIITASAGTLKLYLAGVFVTSVAWAGTIAGTTSWARFNATESGTSNGRQKLLFFRAWNRPLSDVEVVVHYANPWQLFKSPSRVMKAAGFTTYSYTASGGVLFSGTSTSLRGRVLSGLGGVVFSGTASITRTFVQSLTITPIGGLLIRGTSSMVRGVVKLVSGGVNLAGSAAITLTPDPNPVTQRHIKRGRRPRTKT